MPACPSAVTLPLEANRRLPPHAAQYAVAPHEVMVERRADVAAEQDREQKADHAVAEEHALRERAVLRPDRRQLEQPEETDRRAVGRGGDQADDRLDDEQRIE